MTTLEQVTPPPLGEEGAACSSCGAPLATDQRYCLNCGERPADPRVDYARHLGPTGRVRMETATAPRPAEAAAVSAT